MQSASGSVDLTQKQACQTIIRSHTPKARGILFSAPMVRALLDGRKSVTRRIVKRRHPITFLGGKGEENDPACWGYFFDGPSQHGYTVLARGLNEREDHGRISIPCPYGSPGDRLWVRETWAPQPGREESIDLPEYEGGKNPDAVCYRADERKAGEDPRWPSGLNHCVRRWRPAIHMPRWASRITLEVVRVDVQRLHDITEADAQREGVTPFRHDPEGDCWTDGKHRTAFEFLWNEINGWEPNSWAENPWVWRVEFRRVPSNGEEQSK